MVLASYRSWKGIVDYIYKLALATLEGDLVRLFGSGNLAVESTPVQTTLKEEAKLD